MYGLQKTVLDETPTIYRGSKETGGYFVKSAKGNVLRIFTDKEGRVWFLDKRGNFYYDTDIAGGGFYAYTVYVAMHMINKVFYVTRLLQTFFWKKNLLHFRPRRVFKMPFCSVHNHRSNYRDGNVYNLYEDENRKPASKFVGRISVRPPSVFLNNFDSSAISEFSNSSETISSTFLNNNRTCACSRPRSSAR